MSTDQRESIARRIRALRAKTVENGCTEEEAAAAAEMLAKLLHRYNMTMDEAEVRRSPFDHHAEQHDDLVGTRLWKIADAVSFLIGTRYWTSGPGVHPVQIHFFGLGHEVEVSRYMLEICAGAMRREHQRLGGSFLRGPRADRRFGPFMDGMADRLRERIRALVPPRPPGTGLVLLTKQLVDQAMKDAGWQTKQRATVNSRDLERGYQQGRRAGDRVALNQGLSGTGACAEALTDYSARRRA